MSTITKKMKCKFLIPFVVAAMAVLLCPPVTSAAPILGEALASFAVLGAAGVTNVVPNTIGGNLGSAPNPSIGGGYTFTSGSLQANTIIAQNAQIQLDAAIVAVNDIIGASPDFTIADGDLIQFQADHGGVISPGTYRVGALATGNIGTGGTLVLDGGGSSTAQWYFNFTSTLITSTTSNVTVQNVAGGSGVGIYWTVDSAATLNGNTFAGNVLAHDLISSDGNLTIDCGRLLSAETQVTLGINDSISITGCLGGSGGYDQGVDIGSGGTPVPEPGTMMLLGSGLVGLVGWGRKKLRK